MTVKAGPGSIRDLLRNTTLTKAEIARQVGVSRDRVKQVAQKEARLAKVREAQHAEASLPFCERRIVGQPMSTRLRNCFRNVGPDTQNAKHPKWRPPTPTITSVADVMKWTAADLLMLKNFGRSCLNEVRELLQANGFTSERFDRPWYPPREPYPAAPPIPLLPTARGTH